MGKESLKDFFCSFCKETKKIRAKKSQKYCSVECSRNSRINKSIASDSFETREYGIDEIVEAPDVVIKSYVRKNNLLLTKVKNLETECKLLRNNINFSANISLALKESIKALPLVQSIKPPTSKKDYTHEEEAVLLLSDLHSSEIVSSYETDGLSEYNFDIFCLRMQKLQDSLIQVVDIQRKGGAKLETLNVFSLGDLISGEIHLELMKTNEFNLIQSCMQVSVVVAQFLAKLSTVFKNINFYAVGGNHDRLIPEKQIKNKWADFSRIIYETISLLTQNYKNIKYSIPQSPFMIAEIYGWRYLITHGDCGVKGNLIGGMDKLQKEFQEMYRERGGIDLLCAAHYHSPMVIDGVMVNGAMCGGNEYSIFTLRKNTVPSQKFFGVSKNYKTTWQYDVYVDKTPTQHDFVYNKDYLVSDLMKVWELRG